MCTIGAVLNDGLALFKNLDQTRDVVVFKPRICKGRYKYIACRRANRPGIWAGINECGLGLVAADAHTTKKYRAKPHMVDNIFRANEHVVADFKNTEEALEFLSEFYTKNIMVPDIIVIADRKRVVAIEYLPRNFKTKEIRKGFLVRSNHFCFQKYSRKGKSSYSRYKTASNSIQADSTLKGIMKLCKNHENGPSCNSICRHGKWRTIASVIMTAGKKISCHYVINTSPCKSDYKRITL